MNLRRVTGASTANIFGQIVVEMLLLIVVVLLFSFCALELTIPVFEKTFSVIITGKIYGILLVTICVVSALIYLTAFVFYRFGIRKLRSGNLPLQNKFSSNRISLTLQLIISMFFILSAFVLYRQVQFMHNADWGFNKNHLLQIKLELKDREPFMDNVKKLPMVKNVISTSFFTVIQNMDNMGATRVPGVEWEGKPMDYSPVFQTFSAEKNFITDMGITLRMGRGC